MRRLDDALHRIDGAERVGHVNDGHKLGARAKELFILVEEEFTVTRRFMMLGAILGLMAMMFFASWPAWKLIKFRPVSAPLYERTKAAVDKNPRLQPAWDIALQDDVLTWPEAKVILESAGEKAEPDQ